MTTVIEFTHAETYFFLARSYKYVWNEDSDFNDLGKLSEEDLIQYLKGAVTLYPLYNYDKYNMQHWLWIVKIQSKFLHVVKIMSAWEQVNDEMCEEEITLTNSWEFPSMKDECKIDVPKYWEFLRRKADRMNELLASNDIFLKFSMDRESLSKEQEQEEKEKDFIEKSLNPLAKK